MKYLKMLFLSFFLMVSTAPAQLAYAELKRPDFLQQDAESKSQEAGAEIAKWIGIIGGIVGVIMVGIGGFMIMVNKWEESKKIILGAIIGGLVIGFGGGIFWAIVG